MSNTKRRPCSTCPYLKSTPVGVWDQYEYDKLVAQDHEFGSIFGCHLSESPKNATTCIGWLIDQKRRGIPNMKLRLRLMTDAIERKVFEGVDKSADTYESIEVMCEANAGQSFPNENPTARRLADKIERRPRARKG